MDAEAIARQRDEQLRLLKVRYKKLAVFSTILLCLLSLSCLYLLIMQSDLYLLRKRLLSFEVHSNASFNASSHAWRPVTAVDELRTTLLSQLGLQQQQSALSADSQSTDLSSHVASTTPLDDDDSPGQLVMEIAQSVAIFYNQTAWLPFFAGVLRPHYLLFWQSAVVRESSASALWIAWWIFSPVALVPDIVQNVFGVELTSSAFFFVYATVLLVIRLVQLVRRESPNAGNYFFIPLINSSRWLKGVLFRLLMLAVLTASLYIEQAGLSWFSERVLSRVMSVSVLVFIVACFLSTRSFVALLWAVGVCSFASVLPMWSTTKVQVLCFWSAQAAGGAASCAVSLSRFACVAEFLSVLFFLK